MRWLVKYCFTEGLISAGDDSCGAEIDPASWRPQTASTDTLSAVNSISCELTVFGTVLRPEFPDYKS